MYFETFKLQISTIHYKNTVLYTLSLDAAFTEYKDDAIQPVTTWTVAMAAVSIVSTHNINENNAWYIYIMWEYAGYEHAVY